MITIFLLEPVLNFKAMPCPWLYEIVPKSLPRLKLNFEIWALKTTLKTGTPPD